MFTPPCNFTAFGKNGWRESNDLRFAIYDGRATGSICALAIFARMQTKLVIVFALFGIAVLIVLYPASISWLLKLLRVKQPKRIVQFADSIQLEWSNFFWEGTAVLPAWTGLQKRLGPYASVSGVDQSSGEVHLSVSSPEDDIPSAPSEAQVKGFCHVRDNGPAMRDKVLKAIFDVYPKWRDKYKDFLGEGLEKQMPVLHTPSDLRSLIGLSTIHVLRVEKDGLAYVGFEFGCEWEEEHGLGVMSHGDRIIDVGSAEEAFNSSTANEDKSNG